MTSFDPPNTQSQTQIESPPSQSASSVIGRPGKSTANETCTQRGCYEESSFQGVPGCAHHWHHDVFVPRLLEECEGQQPDALSGRPALRTGAARKHNHVSTQPHGAGLEAVPVCKQKDRIRKERQRKRPSIWRRELRTIKSPKTETETVGICSVGNDAYCTPHSWHHVKPFQGTRKGHDWPRNWAAHTGRWCWPAWSWPSSPGSCTCAAGQDPCRLRRLRARKRTSIRHRPTSAGHYNTYSKRQQLRKSSLTTHNRHNSGVSRHLNTPKDLSKV